MKNVSIGVYSQMVVKVALLDPGGLKYLREARGVKSAKSGCQLREGGGWEELSYEGTLATKGWVGTGCMSISVSVRCTCGVLKSVKSRCQHAIN